MNKLYLVLAVLSISCSSELPNNYIVMDSTDLPGFGVTGKNVLLCKLGCKNDPVIDNIESINWNDSLMYIIQKESIPNKYYIIKAREGHITCCNNDILIGPLSHNQFLEKIHLLRLPEKLKKYKEY